MAQQIPPFHADASPVRRTCSSSPPTFPPEQLFPTIYSDEVRRTTPACSREMGNRDTRVVQSRDARAERDAASGARSAEERRRCSKRRTERLPTVALVGAPRLMVVAPAVEPFRRLRRDCVDALLQCRSFGVARTSRPRAPSAAACHPRQCLHPPSERDACPSGAPRSRRRRHLRSRPVCDTRHAGGAFMDARNRTP